MSAINKCDGKLLSLSLFLSLLSVIFISVKSVFLPPSLSPAWLDEKIKGKV
jgi:hypothetical protein